MDKFDSHFDDYINSFFHDEEGKFLSEENIQYPSMYEIFIIDDKNTPKEFMAYVMEDFFHRSVRDLEKFAKKIKQEGRVSCGIYTKDVAETKMLRAAASATENEYELKCVMQQSKQNAIEKS